MRERESYIDNIRVFLTMLVILHHAAITYGAPGGWYYKEEADGFAAGLLFTVFVSTNQAFFMGLFFFLSSYFIPASYERKGESKFILDRFKRLGIPLIFYSLVIAPLTIYTAIAHQYPELSFKDYYLNREHWIEVGVLWFTAALLLFTCIFWLTQRFRDKRDFSPLPLPGNKSVFMFAIALGVISFLVRIVFPIGVTLPPFGFQLAHFPQYIALFTIGIIAYRNQWLPALPSTRGKLWLWLAVGLVFIGFPCIYILKFITHTEVDAFFGGFTIQSFVNAIWEQLLGISIIVALLSIGKYKWNNQSRLLKELSRSAYAVYIVHPLILVCISILLKDFSMNSLLKFAISGISAVAISFMAGMLLVRIPIVKDVV
ncbi:acyltransferase family protein [Ohtaekwangia koreensis]|uniref:Fucose 4-O-acetylase n=1 Tax=Ohtaekwangia koreensis TaxID=688867 RepID=A0A1T5ING8_9BACT|nr:acyltransferase family protein [Ohtaekwangia koreensis]SKC40707.1 Fucose 4-O-acetylase [Ohtaekwangia koreensis]